MTANSIESVIATRWAMFIFIFGKLLRLGLFISFTYFLFSSTKTFLGYNKNEALLFIVTFYFLSAFGQMILRETYRFRPRVISGELDYDLIRPVSPLLKNVFGGFDLQDFLTMPIILGVVVVVMSHLNFNIFNVISYALLCVNTLLIITAIHILMIGLIILTPDVDHGLMIYRDLETMGRFPVDIYKEPLRQILTFVIPIGIMFTVPVKALLGLVSWQGVVSGLVVGLLSITLSFKFWNFAVKKYSSASS